MKILSGNISVIVPCYNSELTVCRAFNSIYDQTLRPLEVIFVDDGSIDNTLSVLENIRYYYNDDFVKILSLSKNRGVSVARNAGWNLARGDFVAFLDSDDAWYPRKLKAQYSLMMSNPELVVSGHEYGRCKSNSLFRKEQGTIMEIKRENILFSNVFQSTSTLMVVNQPDIRFNEEKSYSEEYHLICELILKGKKAALIQEELARNFKYSYGEKGLSQSLFNMEQGELDTYRRLYLKGLLSRCEYFSTTIFSVTKFFFRLIAVNMRKLYGAL